MFVHDAWILAAPGGPFVKKIRSGFICCRREGDGLIRDCIAIMDEVADPLGLTQPLSPASKR